MPAAVDDVMPCVPDCTRVGVCQPEMLFSKPFMNGAGVFAWAIVVVIAASSDANSTALANVPDRRRRCRLREILDLSTATF